MAAIWLVLARARKIQYNLLLCRQPFFMQVWTRCYVRQWVKTLYFKMYLREIANDDYRMSVMRVTGNGRSQGLRR